MSRVVAVLAIACVWSLLWPASPATAAAAAGAFQPPLPPPLTVLAGFDVPAQPWLAGNRGVDLAAYAGEPVRAATAGTVIYAGNLAGRGVISISHGAIRTTYEPVDPVAHVGDTVSQGQLIGHLAEVADACGPPGTCLHWGALRGNVYVDPMALLGAPHVRLLPIWADGTPVSALPGSAPPVPALPRPAAPLTVVSTASSDDHRRVLATGTAAATGLIGAGVGLASLRRRSSARSLR